MCLAIPGQVMEIEGFEAKVDVAGVTRSISLWLTPGAQLGDYVYIHAGYAISVLDAEEALESLRLLQELAESYPEEELFLRAGKPHTP
ncbi:MAG: HypC/HybG/HupF family hydrogenase formation chaperone [Anaerolineae bacterium]|nr:HypC/HybG/HupF family hydrogenase formation chaperone [Anaerolineae bacterium]